MSGPLIVPATKGIQGGVGPIGPQGNITMGPQGARGPQGVSSGTIGPQGPQGISGDAVVGPQGARGPQGNQGEVGDFGPQGTTWATTAWDANPKGAMSGVQVGEYEFYIKKIVGTQMAFLCVRYINLVGNGSQSGIPNSNTFSYAKCPGALAGFPARNWTVSEAGVAQSGNYPLVTKIIAGQDWGSSEYYSNLGLILWENDVYVVNGAGRNFTNGQDVRIASMVIPYFVRQ